MSLTSFKRRWIERWCEDVCQYLRNGSLCNNVIGYPSDEMGGFALQGILKTPLPGKVDSSISQQNGSDHDDGKPEVDTQRGPLPLVRFSYSHFDDQRKKVERLVHGLPVLSNSTTQLEKTSRPEESGMSFILLQGEEHLKTRREKDDVMERGKLSSAPVSLTAQRLAQELKRQNKQVTNAEIRVNIMSTDHINRIKTAPTMNKSNVSRARKLLAKRNSTSRRFDNQPYSPIENCWTMTEVTWS